MVVAGHGGLVGEAAPATRKKKKKKKKGQCSLTTTAAAPGSGRTARDGAPDDAWWRARLATAEGAVDVAASLTRATVRPADLTPGGGGTGRKPDPLAGEKKKKGKGKPRQRLTRPDDDDGWLATTTTTQISSGGGCQRATRGWLELRAGA